MSFSPDVDARIRDLKAEYDRKLAQVLEESMGPVREELRKVEHEIALLTSRANELRAQLDRMASGSSGKGRGERKTRARRPAMSFEQKKAKVEQILREEQIATGFPFSAVAKRLAAEANLSPADLSPVAFQKFLPAGIRVEGSLRNKKFVLG